MPFIATFAFPSYFPLCCGVAGSSLWPLPLGQKGPCLSFTPSLGSGEALEKVTEGKGQHGLGYGKGLLLPTSFATLPVKWDLGQP